MSTTQFSRPRSLVAALALLASACGVVGENGVAVFHVGSDWKPDRPIAVGSVFAVSAQKNDLLKTALTVKSGTPTVINQLSGGSLQAVGEGAATLQALDPSTLAVVDDVIFQVAKPTSAALSWWGDAWVTPTKKLDEKFAVVRGTRLMTAAVVLDAQARQLHHAGIATLTGENFTVSPAVSELFEVTPTVAGPTTATLTINGVDGKPALAPHVYQVTIVEAADVASLDLLPPVSIASGTATPASPDGPPKPVDESAANSASRLYLLVAMTKLADGTRVYGAPLAWTESTPGHILGKTTNGANYVLLKAGETVTVTAQIGALTKQVVVTGP